MKLTKRQLRKIIQESVYMQNEGFLDTVKKGISSIGSGLESFSDYLDLGSTTKTLVKASSQDALNLFKAMKGLGTSEGIIQKIIKKRDRNNSIVDLYKEYNKLIIAIVNPKKTGGDELFDEYIAGDDHAEASDLKKQLGNWDSDLIAWLEGDGMNEEAKLVEEKLKEENVPRIENPAS